MYRSKGYKLNAVSVALIVSAVRIQTICAESLDKREAAGSQNP